MRSPSARFERNGCGHPAGHKQEYITLRQKKGKSLLTSAGLASLGKKLRHCRLNQGGARRRETYGSSSTGNRNMTSSRPRTCRQAFRPARWFHQENNSSEGIFIPMGGRFQTHIPKPTQQHHLRASQSGTAISELEKFGQMGFRWQETERRGGEKTKTL